MLFNKMLSQKMQNKLVHFEMFYFQTEYELMQ